MADVKELDLRVVNGLVSLHFFLKGLGWMETRAIGWAPAFYKRICGPYGTVLPSLLHLLLRPYIMHFHLSY